MKNWVINPQKFEDPIKQLLFNRGIKTEKEAEAFLDPKLENFEKDFNLAGILPAKKRIFEAVANNELIAVFGDYDADGICSLAIMYYAISAIGGKFLPYIPHREKEGYGLSKAGLDFVKEKGASLVITVDNGIVALDQANYAKKIGLDLIITDHHIPAKTLPKAKAIVHSTKFCGAGVTWCLARQLVENKISMELLDLVAIATVCDLSPLLAANRGLVKIGLEKLNRTTKVGLIALFIESRLSKGSITAYHIGHIIGPRLNALGRLEHAIDSLRLLCTKDPVKARDIAKHLSDVNEKKKQLAVDAIDEAREIIKQIKVRNKIIIVSSDKWIPGIMGLVAGRLVEEYGLPAIAISITDGFARGSARSTNNINIVEAIRKCSDLLIDVGGHPKAAGFSIEKKNIETFKTRMGEIMKDVKIPEQEDIRIEFLLNSKKIDKKLIAKLEQFEPTGVDNPKPILASKQMVISDLRTVGEGKHLKFKADNLDTIAFGMGDLAKSLKTGQLINIAYHLELDAYNGFEKIQLKAIDLNF
jgi:single-stranded-DNA-specific exonuclease